LTPVDAEGIKEKTHIALTSIVAAVFLTGFKLIVGLMTGSLGILSEALHSGLDLVAAGITFFAVKYADRPADTEHQYGHGKIENFSALIETLLLVVTCGWIIYEAIRRLLYHTVELEATFWSFAVMTTSIIVDFSRSRALKRVAKKYDSQALEADALHFSTDILSSAVVLLGLIFVAFNYHFADPIAALFVAVVVLWISYQLGKKSFDMLVDRAPTGLDKQVVEIVSALPEVLDFHDIRTRKAGSTTFIELNIHVAKGLSIEQAHDITHVVEEAISARIKNARVLIHPEPD
jgi:cation diffusion facilitator family transporter